MDESSSLIEAKYNRAQDTASPVETTVYIGGIYEAKGAAITKYYSLGGQRIAMRQGSTTTYLHGDHLGSTSVTTSENGGFVGRVQYWPFGATRAQTGTVATDKLYTGQQQEPESALGLYHYGARMYSTLIGRFTSVDPISGQGPQGLNAYSYVRNNPMRFVDPTGMCVPDVDCPGAMPGEGTHCSRGDFLEGQCEVSGLPHCGCGSAEPDEPSSSPGLPVAPPTPTPLPVEAAPPVQTLPTPPSRTTTVCCGSQAANNEDGGGCGLSLRCHATKTANALGGFVNRAAGACLSNLVNCGVAVGASLCIAGRNYNYCAAAGVVKLIHLGLEKGFFRRFMTLDCLGAALDGIGTLAITIGGPWGIPIAAGAYGTSVGIDIYQEDYVGTSASTFGQIASPLQLGEGAAKTFGQRAGAVGTTWSIYQCVRSGF